MDVEIEGVGTIEVPKWWLRRSEQHARERGIDPETAFIECADHGLRHPEAAFDGAD